MIIAIRGASADAIDVRPNRSASRNRRKARLPGVAVHHRSCLQVLNALCQLQVSFAVEYRGQAQVGKPRRIVDVNVGRYADVLDGVA
mgnify:CR=1 FL=1